MISKITFTFNSGSPFPSTMDIYGSGFGTVKPTVLIDGFSRNATLFTDQKVTVDVATPRLDPGAYLVTLTPNSKSSSGDDSKKTVTFSASVGLSPSGLLSLLAGKACPSGNFVTGFDNTGNLVCAPPPAPAPSPSPAPSPAPAPAPSPSPAPAPAPAPSPAPAPAPGPDPTPAP